MLVPRENLVLLPSNQDDINQENNTTHKRFLPGLVTKCIIIPSSTAEAGPSQENIYDRPQEMQRSSERISHGKGKRPLPALRPNEVLQVKKRRLEYHGPAVLQREVWWHLGQLFGFFTQIESRKLKWGDVSLEKDPTTGSERLVLKAGCSSRTNQRPKTLPQAKTDTSPVEIYKEFLSHRPREMNNPDSPFYLAVKQRVKDGNPVWYLKRPQAVNKIGKNNTCFDSKQPTIVEFLQQQC